eukprot:3914299-Pleurochrysis_carterae.AAC.1
MRLRPRRAVRRLTCRYRCKAMRIRRVQLIRSRKGRRRRLATQPQGPSPSHRPSRRRTMRRRTTSAC